ncbi:hypothetical protein Ct61P_15011 [Colletotrichum tofieldiae]|nr:hypothetical protein Ct61P_15011 [Colletotrichum tofieldiae]
MSGNRSDFARDEDESSYKREPYDDFILFPDESQTDTYEDVSAYTEQPAAPLAPASTGFARPTSHRYRQTFSSSPA